MDKLKFTSGFEVNSIFGCGDITFLLLEGLWVNGRFLGLSLAADNYDGDICLGNMCCGNIGPGGFYFGGINFF